MSKEYPEIEVYERLGAPVAHRYISRFKHSRMWFTTRPKYTALEARQASEEFYDNNVRKDNAGSAKPVGDAAPAKSGGLPSALGLAGPVDAGNTG